MAEQVPLIDNDIPPEVVNADILQASIKIDWDKKTQLQKAHAVLDYMNRLTSQNTATVNPKGKPTSNAKLVTDRLAEGYAKDDFKKVIDSRHREWSADDKMCKYLRPSTLFAKRNFENYLASSGVRVGPRANSPAVIKDPDMLESLTEFLDEWKLRRQPWGFNMPAESVTAAKWWRDVMQPKAEKREAAQQKVKKNGDVSFDFPYLDRMIYTIRKYMLERPENQRIIFGCAEEGVFWKGESMEAFYSNDNSVYNETLNMREIGIEEYKRDARNRVASLPKHFVTGA